jgi:branched-chain amino acid transport system ATP-binding protein
MPPDEAGGGLVVVAENVTKRFGGLTAVNAVSIEARRGEILGLIGPNGAGKTTLFNLVAGSMSADSGRIRFNGIDVTRASASRMCSLGLTRTFQNPRPFRKLTVLQNVAVGGISNGDSVRAAERTAVEVLERVGLAHRQDDPAEILPLGQLKRLEIARCLATHPSTVLLDEPTGGLGAGEVDELASLISELPQSGLTVVLIEHNMGVALRLCSRIYVLNFGQVIATGTGSEVTRNPDVIAAYLGDQRAAETEVANA